MAESAEILRTYTTRIANLHSSIIINNHNNNNNNTHTVSTSPSLSPTRGDFMGKSCSPLLTPQRDPDMKHMRQHLSPAVCNGYGNGISPLQTAEEGGRQDSGIAEDLAGYSHQHHRDMSPRHGHNVRELKRRRDPTRTGDQDGPLDFSVKRRDSVSESFTDDSGASSSMSPPPPSFGHYSSSSHHHPGRSPSSSRSPHPAEHELHVPRDLALHPPPGAGHRLAHPHLPQHQSLGDLEGRGGHAQSALRRSPGSSPDLLHDTSASPGLLKASPRVAPPNPSLAALGMMAESGGAGTGAITPAAMAAVLGQSGAQLGPLASLSAFMGGAGKLPLANGGKVQRPFKAYPKEALQMPLGYLGLPGINPFSSLDPAFLQGMSMNPEDIMSAYKQQIDMLKEKQAMASKMTNVPSSPPLSAPPASFSSSSLAGTVVTNTNGSNLNSPYDLPHAAKDHYSSYSHSSTATSLAGTSTSPPTPTTPVFLSATAGGSSSSNSSINVSNLPPGHVPNSGSPFSTPTAPPLVSSSTSAGGSAGSRKRPRTLPDNQKDDAYWERRRKNNDAAKRSRDARRAKEDEIAIRAALLEQENLKLRVEVAALRSETHRLRCMLYNT